MEKMVPQNIPLLPSDIQKTIGLYLILPIIVFPGSRAPYTVLLAKNNMVLRADSGLCKMARGHGEKVWRCSFVDTNDRDQ